MFLFTSVVICWYRYQSLSVSFHSLSQSVLLLFLLFVSAGAGFLLHVSLLHLCSSPPPPFLASTFCRQPRLSTMPFGCSVSHFSLHHPLASYSTMTAGLIELQLHVNDRSIVQGQGWKPSAARGVTDGMSGVCVWEISHQYMSHLKEWILPSLPESHFEILSGLFQCKEEEAIFSDATYIFALFPSITTLYRWLWFELQGQFSQMWPTCQVFDVLTI